MTMYMCYSVCMSIKSLQDLYIPGNHLRRTDFSVNSIAQVACGRTNITIESFGMNFSFIELPDTFSTIRISDGRSTATRGFGTGRMMAGRDARPPKSKQ